MHLQGEDIFNEIYMVVFCKLLNLQRNKLSSGIKIIFNVIIWDLWARDISADVIDWDLLWTKLHNLYRSKPTTTSVLYLPLSHR